MSFAGATDIVWHFMPCAPISAKAVRASKPLQLVNGLGFPGGLRDRYQFPDALANEMNMLETLREALAEAAVLAARERSFERAGGFCACAHEYASALRDFNTNTPPKACGATFVFQNTWRASQFTKMRFPHDGRGAASGKMRLQPPGAVAGSERMVAARSLAEEERFAWFTVAETAFNILWASIVQWSSIPAEGDLRESLLMVAGLGDEATRMLIDGRLWPPYPAAPQSTRLGEFYVATAVVYFLVIEAAATVLVTTTGGRHEQLCLSEKELFRGSLARAVAVIDYAAGGSLSFSPMGFFLRTVNHAVTANVCYDVALLCLSVANTERTEGHPTNPRHYVFIAAAALATCRLRMAWAQLSPPAFYLESMLVHLLRLGVVSSDMDRLAATIERCHRTACLEGEMRAPGTASEAGGGGPSPVSQKLLLPHAALCQHITVHALRHHMEQPLARFPGYVTRQP